VAVDRRCAVHRPEHPTEGAAQLPEPEAPDIRPEAEPWMPPRWRARLIDPLEPTCPETLNPDPPPLTLPLRDVIVRPGMALHRKPLLAVSDTVQIPSKSAGSALAAPERIRPAVRHRAAVARFISNFDIVLSSVLGRS
jgi:hypothetical protein